MLSKRIIACLDVRNGQVVKGVNFEGLRNAGDPAELAARYNEEGIDEVVILDVTATLESRRALADTISAVAKCAAPQTALWSASVSISGNRVSHRCHYPGPDLHCGSDPDYPASHQGRYAWKQ